MFSVVVWLVFGSEGNEDKTYFLCLSRFFFLVLHTLVIRNLLYAKQGMACFP